MELILKRKIFRSENSKNVEFLGDMNKGISRVKQNGKWGILDYSGNEIVPFEFEEIISLSYSEGLIGIKKDGKWGFVDREGNSVVPTKYDSIFPLYGKFGITKVQLNRKWGLLDREGEELTNINYARVEMFGKGIMLVEINGKLEFLSFDENPARFRKRSAS